jgi:hypothetical protein
MVRKLKGVSSVGITAGWTAGIPFPAGTREYTGSGAHPVSYPVVTGDDFPGVKRPVCEADHSHLAPKSKWWSYTSTSQICFHVVMIRDKFTFYTFKKTQILNPRPANFVVHVGCDI